RAVGELSAAHRRRRVFAPGRRVRPARSQMVPSLPNPFALPMPRLHSLPLMLSALALSATACSRASAPAPAATPAPARAATAGQGGGSGGQAGAPATSIASRTGGLQRQDGFLPIYLD